MDECRFGSGEWRGRIRQATKDKLRRSRFKLLLASSKQAISYGLASHPWEGRRLRIIWQPMHKISILKFWKILPKNWQCGKIGWLVFPTIQFSSLYTYSPAWIQSAQFSSASSDLLKFFICMDYLALHCVCGSQSPTSQNRRLQKVHVSLFKPCSLRTRRPRVCRGFARMIRISCTCNQSLKTKLYSESHMHFADAFFTIENLHANIFCIISMHLSTPPPTLHVPIHPQKFHFWTLDGKRPYNNCQIDIHMHSWPSIQYLAAAPWAADTTVGIVRRLWNLHAI